MNSIMTLQEAGILRKFYYDELNAPVYEPLPRFKINQPIDINMMITAFMFMTVMLLLSLLTFIIEYCIGQRLQVNVPLTAEELKPANSQSFQEKKTTQPQ